LEVDTLTGKVDIQWVQTYGGYIALLADLTPDIVINPANSKPMNPGDLMTVQDDSTAVVRTNWTAGNISILNGGKRQWICGMSQMISNTLSPFCAFPLFGQNTVQLIPVEQVLLLFKSGQSGGAVEKMTSSAIVITLTNDDLGQVKSIAYDINNGWNAGGAAWAQIITGQVDIAATLIQ
jgi:hypothetical protein